MKIDFVYVKYQYSFVNYPYFVKLNRAAAENLVKELKAKPDVRYARIIDGVPESHELRGKGV